MIIDRLTDATKGYADVAIDKLMALDRVLALILGGLIAALWQRVRVAGRQTLSLSGLLLSGDRSISLIFRLTMEEIERAFGRR